MQFRMRCTNRQSGRRNEERARKLGFEAEVALGKILPHRCRTLLNISFQGSSHRPNGCLTTFKVAKFQQLTRGGGEAKPGRFGSALAL